MIIEVFPYIILFDFCPDAKSAKLNSTPNFVDLQYVSSVPGQPFLNRGRKKGLGHIMTHNDTVS